MHSVIPVILQYFIKKASFIEPLGKFQPILAQNIFG